MTVVNNVRGSLKVVLYNFFGRARNRYEWRERASI